MKYLQKDLKISVTLLFLGMKPVKSRLVGALEILRKATISCVMSVRMEQLPSHLKDFHEI